MTWRSVPFGAVCHLVNGKAFQPTDWSDAGIPIVRIQNLNGPEKPFNYWAGSLEKQVVVRGGDLLLAWSGTPGSSFGTHIWSGPAAVLNQHIFRCDLDHTSVTPKWARFAVNARLNRLIDLAHGGVGLKHVTRGVVEELEIPLPPLAEQRRIAEILDKADALRAKRRAALAQLDTLTQSIFLDMFGDPVRNPKWPVHPLGSLLSFLRYGPRFYNETYSDDGVRIVRISDLTESGLLDFASMPKLAVSNEEFEKSALKAGDIIFARTGATVGKTAVVRECDPPCIAGAYFIVMRFNEKIEPVYGRSVLSSPSIREIVARRSRQAAQQNFSGPGLRELRMPVPPISLQRSYSTRVAAVDHLARPLQSSQHDLKRLFASLQHRAFRGEL